MKNLNYFSNIPYVLLVNLTIFMALIMIMWSAPAVASTSVLTLMIQTGEDDLRGGRDNLNVIVHVRGQPPQMIRNVNRSERWPDYRSQTVRISLRTAVPITDICRIELSTAFGGGLGGENWDMNSLRVYAFTTEGNITIYDGGSSRVTIGGTPLFRFTGENRRFSAVMRGNSCAEPPSTPTATAVSVRHESNLRDLRVLTRHNRGLSFEFVLAHGGLTRELIIAVERNPFPRLKCSVSSSGGAAYGARSFHRIGLFGITSPRTIRYTVLCERAGGVEAGDGRINIRVYDRSRRDGGSITDPVDSLVVNFNVADERDAAVGRRSAPVLEQREQRSAAAPAAVANSTCADNVQNKIAWDYKGNKRWAPANLTRLCRGAENSAEPGRCFNRVMHGGINWGGGTKWQWENAIDLCEGSTNASATISCFQTKIGKGNRWADAIRACGK